MKKVNLCSQNVNIYNDNIYQTLIDKSKICKDIWISDMNELDNIALVHLGVNSHTIQMALQV